MNELELFTWAASVFSPINRRWGSHTDRTRRCLAVFLTFSLDLFFDSLDLILLFLYHLLDRTHLILECRPVLTWLHHIRWIGLVMRALSHQIDFIRRCSLKLLRTATRFRWWLDHGIEDFWLWLRLWSGTLGLGHLCSSLRRCSLCFHIHWKLEGVKLRLLQVLVEVGQLARLQEIIWWVENFARYGLPRYS